MTAEGMKAYKAKQLRYKKPIAKGLNLDDTLLNALGGDEDDAFEFKAMFSELAVEGEQMQEDLRNEYVPEYFDLFFAAVNKGGEEDEGADERPADSGGWRQCLEKRQKNSLPQQKSPDPCGRSAAGFGGGNKENIPELKGPAARTALMEIQADRTGGPVRPTVSPSPEAPIFPEEGAYGQGRPCPCRTGVPEAGQICQGYISPG